MFLFLVFNSLSLTELFYAELNEVLTRELAEDGYSGVEVWVTPMRTEIIIRATRTQNVLGNAMFLLCICLASEKVSENNATSFLKFGYILLEVIRQRGHL